ncbi:MAG TPA: hypothetical protein VN201_06820 [Roseateles sp.]|nr:hypothetical protein [Roseateles sp.]
MLEHWIHGFEHLLPWAGLAGLPALSPEQTKALLHLPGQAADWTLRLKPEPPWGYTLTMVVLSKALNVLPFAEEA